ncbi:hypothetical protein CAZ10_10215 [Pseudomonas aeruginosa]|uniref:Uncharacterized protein n=1 Tax=Pseudomonas aeruginosa TaxID=287 RepID=A0A241XRT1_PSEAI|nr:hypothetical protein A9513_001055 [Pseudomonas sp. AU12215]OTI63199.1 hypothetical protein CAZ10_10215 [Pseudomonas aeruginosa]
MAIRGIRSGVVTMILMSTAEDSIMHSATMIGFASHNFPFGVDSDGWPFDPKGDPDLQLRLKFFMKGQTAYGEWFKRLGPGERPPRGRCTRFFKSHKHLRPTSSLISACRGKRGG